MVLPAFTAFTKNAETKLKIAIINAFVLLFIHVFYHIFKIKLRLFHALISSFFSSFLSSNLLDTKEADIGIAGGINEGLIIKKGEVIKKVPEDQLINELRLELLNWKD